MTNSTQNDWKEEIAYIIRHDITHVQASNSKYKNQLTAVVLIKYFTQLLADARREVIDRVESEDVVNRAWIKIDGNEFILVGKEFLATLKEETI